MKLLDLLVEKLEEWPEEAGYVAQDDNGCVYWFQRKPILAHDNSWCSEFDACFYIDYYDPCTDWQTAIITREMWEEAKMVKSDKQWPSVGDVCEVFAHSNTYFPPEAISLVGKKIVITSVFENRAGSKMVTYEEFGIDDGDTDVIIVECLRPLSQKTPKELWAEKAIIASDSVGCGREEEYGLIYDAGLAKDIDNEN